MLTKTNSIKTLVFIAFCTIVLITFYVPLKETLYTKNITNRNSSFTIMMEVYTYGELESQLCQRNIDWSKKTEQEYDDRVVGCPNEDIVTVGRMGRTGNLMWAYASVMALAEQTGLKPYIPSCIKSHLEVFLDNLTLPTFENISHCPVKFNTFVKSIKEWENNRQSIILPRYMVRPAEIIPWIPNIWQEFTIKQTFRDYAQDTLRTILKKVPPDNYTFVGVHVRRTDYKAYLTEKYNLTLAPKQFYLNAMAHLRKKYTNSLFIFVSDDLKWCSEEFGQLIDVFIVPTLQGNQNSPAQDLAILAACNHTILDYGTFGEWGAILAGGEVVVYNMRQNNKTGSMQYHENWSLMS